MTHPAPRTAALALLALSLAALPAGCGNGKPGTQQPPARAAALPAGVVATVDGEAVTTEDFAGTLGAAAFSGRQASSEGRMALLLERIDTLLFEKAARQARVHERPMVRRMIERMRRRYAIWEVRRRILEKVAVAPAEIDAAFKEPGEILDLTVLLADDREAAEKALARVQAGEDFAAVAREVSISPGAARGNVSRPGLERGEGMYPPEVEEAVFAVPAGKISAPLETPVGWLVARVDGRKRATAEEIAKLRASVGETLRMRKATAAIADAVRGGNVKVLRERYAGAGLPDPAGNPAAVWRALEEVRVAEADGTLLTLGDVFRDVADYQLMKNKTPESREEIYRMLLQQQVDEVRLFGRARAEGLERLPVIEEAVAGYTRSLLTAQLTADIILGVVAGDQDRCQAYFEERREHYLPGERLDLAQILVRREAEARAIMAQLASGGDFSALAREKSLDKSASGGGRMPWASEAALAEVFGKDGAAVLLQRGRAKQPEALLLRTTSGYHIVRVQGFQGAGEGSFEQVRDRVTPDFLTFCQREAIAKYREKLRGAAVIVIDDEKVRNVQPADPQPGSGLQPHGGVGRSGGGSPHGGMGAPGGSPHGGMGAPGGSPHGGGAPKAP